MFNLAMKTQALYLGVALLCTSLHAQITLPDGSYQGDHLPQRKIPAPYVREADVTWAGRYWQIIDLRQKINQPMYFPFEPTDGRYNLLWVLKEAIRQEKVRTFARDDFKEPMTAAEALAKGSRTDTFMIPQKDPPYTPEPKAVHTPLNPEDVQFFKIKEEWFFDRSRSMLDFRIIAIAPVMNVHDPSTGELRYRKEMFWIPFEELRPVLAAYLCYNPWNLSKPLSYEDLFKNRMFHALIYKKDNVMDRHIASYAKGTEALLEANELKEDLRLFESDLWSQ